MQMAWTEKKSWGEGDPNRTRDDGEALGRKGEKGSVPESKTLGVGPVPAGDGGARSRLRTTAP